MKSNQVDFKLSVLKKEEEQKIDMDELAKLGTINVLALGYKGIELWRQKREPIPKNKTKDENEKEA